MTFWPYREVLIRRPPDERTVAVPIKKEVQQFIIASEHLYRLFAHGESLNSHEAEILNCCMDELLKRRLANLACPQNTAVKTTR